MFLTWLLGVSRGDTWLFLPDLVEVWDVECSCCETLVSRGRSGVPCVGDPEMWHPSGRLSCWCRDSRARRNTRGGVALVGRDLIAAHEAVAIRFSVVSVTRSLVPSVVALGCSSLTSWCVHGPGWLCLWALNLVEV
ncbi:hypothetical protein Taro_021960 [Colocasia esculenta]|uniref:Uncharacterized protein n=1 Tax=Colocasia esculenta TaxID=4460 RepID=A0A843UT16_COLES|nr:hypothetical protein [Colocasia esculenta]